jgi:hypothetical protein
MGKCVVEKGGGIGPSSARSIPGVAGSGRGAHRLRRPTARKPTLANSTKPATAGIFVAPLLLNVPRAQRSGLVSPGSGATVPGSVPLRCQLYLRSMLTPTHGSLATQGHRDKTTATGSDWHSSSEQGRTIGAHCLPFSRRGYCRITFDSEGSMMPSRNTRG